MVLLQGLVSYPATQDKGLTRLSGSSKWAPATAPRHEHLQASVSGQQGGKKRGGKNKNQWAEALGSGIFWVSLNSGAVRRAGARRGEQGTETCTPAGPLVHEPVSLKACLCLASLLEAHLLISTKEKNGVGNIWMCSLPCLGSQVPRTRYSAWGRKQGESWKYREKVPRQKTSVFHSQQG